MIAPARAAAFNALRAVGTGRVDLGAALARAREGLADSRDRALCSEIVTGTLRARDALDHQIARVYGRPLARLDDEVLMALRMGLYQLLYLERVPASAVVNDAVALVRKARKASATGLVNGILRRLARERDSLPWPPRPDSPVQPSDRADAIRYLATSGSHPAWLVERWLDRHGFEKAEAWVRFNNTPAPLTIRANSVYGRRDEIAGELAALAIPTRPTNVAPEGLIVEAGQLPERVAGAPVRFLIQDEASQLIPELLQVTTEAWVLDACASPGGKTVAIAGALGPQGLVVAADVRAHRVALLAATLRSAGVRPRVVHMSPDGGWPFLPRFTHVLVDAPCSGLGTVRRDPDIRWRREPEDLARLATVQDRLLGHASSVVAAGGRLVYSTCSSEPEENEAVVRRFLQTHPQFSLRPLETLAGLPPAIAALADNEGFLRTDPSRDGLEAFFAAVMQRNQDS